MSLEPHSVLWMVGLQDPMFGTASFLFGWPVPSSGRSAQTLNLIMYLSSEEITAVFATS